MSEEPRARKGSPRRTPRRRRHHRRAGGNSDAAAEQGAAAAQTVACQSNLRQVALAIFMYAEGNKACCVSHHGLGRDRQFAAAVGRVPALIEKKLLQAKETVTMQTLRGDSFPSVMRVGTLVCPGEPSTRRRSERPVTTYLPTTMASRATT
jgi:hypothetical protein